MSIDDHITVEDYGQKDVGTENQVHSAHQMLLLTMKGSKGASWSAKPALLFMMELFHFAVKIIQQHGERSRTLVAWYLKNPSKLYLPPELEHLRGKDISQANLRLIWSLGEKNNSKSGSASRFFLRLKSKCFKAPNPLVHLANGTKNARKSIDFLHWNDVEIHLLNNVHRALAACRRVTPENHYHGDLSKMLCLFDTDGTPYLPGACNYRYIATRLKPHRGRSTKSNPESLSPFEKLGITMPVSGEIRTAEIDSHDPRRWLTTMALRYGEKLSEVLINLWANRFSLQQLKAYDLRSPLELAAMSQMPLTTELADLSAGLDQADKLSDEYGLTTAIVTVHHAGISVTSMDLVMQATEDRPVARTSSGIFIIYPSRFGVCVHPHHAMPCTNYNSCITCDNNGVVKGHLPTNEALRERDKKLLTSIVRQLETLATTHNRRLADDQDDLAEHMLALVRNGLNHEAVQAFAKHLIQDFHSLKHRLKDKLLVARLEEAFVASGYVKLLGDPDVASGAYLKYHNPTVHASPLLEMAIDDRDGGRDQIKRDNEEFIRKYPIFNLNVLPTPEQKRLAAEVAAAEGEEDNHDEE